MHDVGFLDDLEIRGDVSLDEGRREDHASDWASETVGRGVTPDAVVYPESTEDVSTVLRECDDRGVPVTPYAAGTGLEGNVIPVEHGVSLDLTRMDDVTDVRADDFQVDVEPGVMGTAVNEAVERHGLFFPPLPSSGAISTIGGMIATDAGGMQTVKYGKVGDWTLALEAVLADGTVIQTGSQAVKTSSGYNLTDLLVGSEGTLAVVTHATLRLKGIPQEIRGGRALFDSIDDAADAVSDAVRSEVDVAKIELIDDVAARMANDYAGSDLPDTPMVFLEFHANHGVEREIEFCRDVFEAHDVAEFDVRDEDEMDELWQLRRDLGMAVRSYDPSLTPVQAGDVAVPISRYPEMMKEIKRLAREHDLLMPCFGHAGDGNVHYVTLVDGEDSEEYLLGQQVYERVVELAIEMGGTATAEHGVGVGKRKFMQKEHGEGGVEAMRRVKRALDPNGTLNPGKILPSD
ncbi:MAG: FAD-binding oxidoreductase [Halobacteriales archaeon]